MSDDFPELIFDDQIKMNLEASVHILGHAYGLHPIIYRNKDDQRLHCKLMEWGCIPFYVKELKGFQKQRASMLNARSERILADNKSYWNKIRNRRCLMPVTGFYEHRQVKGLTKKVPYYIQLKNQPIFYLPGLYSVSQLADEQGELHKTWSVTIITRAANKVMAQIHNAGENATRMPLMLPLDLSKKWVTEDLSPQDYQDILDFEMPDEALEFKTVYTIRSAKARPDNKAKNEEWNWGVKVPEIVL